MQNCNSSPNLPSVAFITPSGAVQMIGEMMQFCIGSCQKKQTDTRLSGPYYARLYYPEVKRQVKRGHELRPRFRWILQDRNLSRPALRIFRARSGYADETLHGFLSNSTSRPGDDTRYR